MVNGRNIIYIYNIYVWWISAQAKHHHAYVWQWHTDFWEIQLIYENIRASYYGLKPLCRKTQSHIKLRNEDVIEIRASTDKTNFMYTRFHTHIKIWKLTGTGAHTHVLNYVFYASLRRDDRIFCAHAECVRIRECTCYLGVLHRHAHLAWIITFPSVAQPAWHFRLSTHRCHLREHSSTVVATCVDVRLCLCFSPRTHL